MSKFVDKLAKLSRSSGPSIGFKRSAATSGPSLLLVVEVSGSDVSEAKSAVAVGIDALVVRVDSMVGQAAALKSAAKLAGDMGWGVHISRLGPDDAATLRDLGCDFVILDASAAPAAVLSEKNLGKILQVDSQWGDGMIRSLDQLALDALLLDADDDKATGLSLHRLLLCQRLATLSRKPLIVSVLQGLNSTELQALHSIGIEGILCRYQAGSDTGPLQEMKRAIEALPAYRGRGKGIAILPRIEAASPAQSEEEEEDEDEEEE